MDLAVGITLKLLNDGARIPRHPGDSWWTEEMLGEHKLNFLTGVWGRVEPARP
jgi:hypothetical protein